MLLMLRKWKYKVYQWNRRCSKNKESQGPHYSKTIWPLNIIFEAMLMSPVKSKLQQNGKQYELNDKKDTLNESEGEMISKRKIMNWKIG